MQGLLRRSQSRRSQQHLAQQCDKSEAMVESKPLCCSVHRASTGAAAGNGAGRCRRDGCEGGACSAGPR
eukprot:6192453-Pleurochrysis_carterae.AAC.5